MKHLSFNSVRGHFAYDADRSSISPGNYFYNYLHHFNNDEDEKAEHHQRSIYLVIEPHEITLKEEVLVYKHPDKADLISTRFKNLLVVPTDTSHRNFAAIETNLIRLQNERSSTECEHAKNTFELILLGLVEDLYVNQYFRECGNVQKVKSALEHIPLIQGIILKSLFDYYYPESISNDRDFRSTYKRKNFEDAYLSYSRFLSQPSHEKLFLKGGWFVKKESGNLDSELNRIEQCYLQVNKKDKLIFIEPVNTKQILKRYGIVDILQLILPKSWVFFRILLSLLVFFVLGDVIVFNNPITLASYQSFAETGMLISGLFFSLYTVWVIISIISKKQFDKSALGLFLPRLTIAILSGWLVFLTAEELLKIDMDIGGWLLVAITLLTFITTIIFMVFEINEYAPSMIQFEVLKRALVVTGLAFVVSYTFGFWVMSHINDKYLSVDNFLVNESKFMKEFAEQQQFYEETINSLKHESNEIFESSSRLLPDRLKEITEVRKIDSIFKKSITNYTDTLTKTQKNPMTSINADTNRLVLVNHLQSALASFKSPSYYFREYLAKNGVVDVNETKVYTKQYAFLLNKTTFPNMLLTRALLAMFIGIFFYLIIQDKTITEPI